MDVYADFANVTLDPRSCSSTRFQIKTGGMTIWQDRINLVLPTIGLHAQF